MTVPLATYAPGHAPVTQFLGIQTTTLNPGFVAENICDILPPTVMSHYQERAAQGTETVPPGDVVARRALENRRQLLEGPMELRAVKASPPVYKTIKPIVEIGAASDEDPSTRIFTNDSRSLSEEETEQWNREYKAIKLYFKRMLSLGLLKQAETALINTLEGVMECYGDNTEPMAYMFLLMSELRITQGKYEDAETNITRALDIVEELEGKESNLYILFCFTQGGSYLHAGVFSNADIYFKRGLEIGTSITGDGTVFVISIFVSGFLYMALKLNNIAYFKTWQNQYTNLVIEIYGENSTNTASTCIAAAHFCFQFDLEALATEYIEKAIAIYTKATESDAAEIFDRLVEIGEGAISNDDHELAKKAYEAYIKVADRIPKSQGDKHKLAALQELATLNTRLNDRPAAINNILEALHLVKKTKGEDSDLYVSLLKDLIEAYEQTNNHQAKAIAQGELDRILNEKAVIAAGEMFRSGPTGEA